MSRSHYLLSRRVSLPTLHLVRYTVPPLLSCPVMGDTLVSLIVYVLAPLNGKNPMRLGTTSVLSGIQPDVTIGNFDVRVLTEITFSFLQAEGKVSILSVRHKSSTLPCIFSTCIECLSLSLRTCVRIRPTTLLLFVRVRIVPGRYLSIRPNILSANNRPPRKYTCFIRLTSSRPLVIFNLVCPVVCITGPKWNTLGLTVP